MNTVLLADIGSTFTKVVAIDRATETLIGTAMAPTTVATDVRLGLRQAIARLEETSGQRLRGAYTRVSSSAAGGLRMVAVGLVPSLTTQAARFACLGAGAKVIHTCSYELSADEVAEINRLQPELLLLVGGTDGGDRRTILHNARALAGGLAISTAVLLAANKSAAPEARALLQKNPGLEVEITENVLPELDRINLEPAREAIRGLFLRRITRAKGIDRLQEGEFAAEIVMPTPQAVLQGAELLATGTATESGLGDLIVLDIGGATTDVHSLGQGAGGGRLLKGLPEPFAKRTVEGDLGLRSNAATLLEVAGADRVAAETGLPAERLRRHVAWVSGAVDAVPRDDDEARLDAALAAAAGGLALERHAGRIERFLTPTGPVEVQYGKDLTAFATLIGTGGVFARGTQANSILAAALRWSQASPALTPREPTPLVDRDYLLFAAGLLRGVADDLAIRLLKSTLVPAEAAGSAAGTGQPAQREVREP